jgi:hypothetical protein
MPLKLWKVNGIAIANFVATLRATGQVANAAARLADSRCHPVTGAMRYAIPKRYKEPDKVAPVIRCRMERYHVICGL